MVVHYLEVSQQKHLTKHRRSWSQHHPHFHAANQRRPEVSRETEGRLWLAAWKWGRCWLHER